MKRSQHNEVHGVRRRGRDGRGGAAGRRCFRSAIMPVQACKRRLGRGRAAWLATACLALFSHARATDAAQDATRSLYLFAGRYTRETTGDSLNPFATDHEDNYLAGVAFGRDVSAIGRQVMFGWEIGGAARFAERRSGEMWCGLNFRHGGMSFPRILTVRLSLALGISLINQAIGTEREREARGDRDARVLYYVGPEMAFSLRRHSAWELVYRLHHRSGGLETLGNMSEGHNANAFGVRRRF